MNLRETLTKENFWNEIYSKYPNACQLFCDWIDEYKKAVNWDVLFNPKFKVVEKPSRIHSAPKFHDLPYEIQAGIWMSFVNDTLPKFVEQPDHFYLHDLEEDIKIVFDFLEGEINPKTPNQ